MSFPTAVWLALLLLLSLPRPVPAQEAKSLGKGRDSCRVGLYQMALGDISLQDRTFGAQFWIWSRCASKDLHPLKSMDFVNAKSAEASLDYASKTRGLYYEIHKIIGTFGHNWDARNFPFDRHTLVIECEDAIYDNGSFVYEADRSNSGYSPAIDLPEWRITDFRLNVSESTYDTNFGDPALASGSRSVFSHLTVALTLVRKDRTNFLKLIVPVYLAVIVAFTSLLLHKETSAQLGLLAAMLFTIILNLQTASGFLGVQKGVTLLGKIHILGLFYVVALTLITIGSKIGLDKGGNEATVQRLSYLCFLIGGLSFVAVNVVLIQKAIHAG